MEERKENILSRFLHNSGLIVFVMSIMASGINYLFQIIAGRFLNVADYGILSSLFSVINIIAVTGTAFGLSITKYVADNGEISHIKLTDKLQKQMLYISPVFIVITFIIVKIMDYSVVTSLLTSVTVFFMSVTFLYYGVLQGKKSFMDVSVFNLIQPVIKLIGGFILLLLGLKYHGALLAMSIGAVMAMLYGRIKINKISVSGEANPQTKPIYKYFAFTLLSTLFLMLFNNMDILLIKQFFDEKTVGLYSCAALFGKIILYIPTAFTIIMIPNVAENKSERKKMLSKTLGISFGMSCLAALGLFVLKKPIIKILMGDKFLPSTEYVLPICGMMLTLVILTVLVNYMIAKNDKWFVTIGMSIGTVVALLTVYLFHSTVSTTVISLSIVYFILCIVLGMRCFLVNEK